MKLEDSVRQIKGVGEKAEQYFNKIDIWTVHDLIEHYPRAYDHFSYPVSIGDLHEGDRVAISGFLKSHPKMKQVRNMKILSVEIVEGNHWIGLTWFGMPFLQKQLHMGTRYIFRGKVIKKNGQLMMQQPQLYLPEEYIKLVNKMVPIYRVTKGLTNNGIGKAVKNIWGQVEELTEFLPSEIRKRNQLVTYGKAREGLHFPKDNEEYKKARRRVVFDELFLYQLALKQMRQQGVASNAHVIVPMKEIARFIESLPYQLTKGQQDVLEQIGTDMAGDRAMNRLVQGDVGSGKTIVAVIALLQVVKNGFQGAFMAPTEVLATQHYNSICGLLKDYDITIGLLTGSMTAKEKKEARKNIAEGTWDIIIGTHAVIVDSVEFRDVALVVTDEQHRFGVKQREALYRKGKEPHVLAMSATPIPRSLALVLYGDMDLSVIDVLPANRLPIKNCVVGTGYRSKAYEFMEAEIHKGHQVYVICPMVDENEELELENVTMYREELLTRFGNGIRIESLHGKKKPKEKNDIMKDFASGEIDILVSTTVIEVGIDVPNATVILIENAERFGLAGLHQLRGRVGRGQAQSYCILMAGTDNKEALDRLNIVGGSNDGFYIAAEDLKLRGQGDFFGTRQSGDLFFKVADIYEDADILKQANQEAKEFTVSDVNLMCRKNEKLKLQLERYMGYVPI